MGDSVDDRDFFVNLPIHMDAKKTLKYVVLTVVLANLVLIAIVLLGAKTPPREPMPNPNGYDEFVRAGQMLTGRAVYYYLTNDQSALADFVSKNEGALRRLRVGLSEKSRVPNDYTQDYTKKQRQLQEFLPFRDLGYLLCAEGKLAETRRRTNDASNSYLDCVKFGESFANGGTIFVKLVGIAAEHEPRQRLMSLVENLDAPKCRASALRLEAFNTEEDPVNTYLKSEREWVKASSGFRDRLEELLEYRQLRRVKNEFIGRYQTNRLERIQLTVSFAERAYELEKGKRPQNIADLVPEYLKSIPIDPFTGTNIAYLPR